MVRDHSLIQVRGRSQTTFTRGGGQVVQKHPLFVNNYKVEHTNAGGLVVKKSQNLVNVVCERPLRQKKGEGVKEKSDTGDSCSTLIIIDCLFTLIENYRVCQASRFQYNKLLLRTFFIRFWQDRDLWGREIYPTLCVRLFFYLIIQYFQAFY